MAKQRRARPRPVTKKPTKPAPRASVRPAGPVRSSSRAVPGAQVRSARPAPRTGYLEAVALYERGLEALQKHAYAHAASLFRSVLTNYPDEKELHERVRLYLNVCERQAAPRESTPQSAEERIYAATLAVNTGHYVEALGHLRAVNREEPENDHALYMLAVVHALRQESAEATPFLLRAISLNPENRTRARQDPDLENLRRDEAFRAAMDALPSSRPERRRPARSRGAR